MLPVRIRGTREQLRVMSEDRYMEVAYFGGGQDVVAVAPARTGRIYLMEVGMPHRSARKSHRRHQNR
jgi:hypothetical protein